MVGVQGRLQTGSYTNKDGATVYTTDVVAERVEFLEWGDRQSQGSDSYHAPAPQYQSQPREEQAPRYSEPQEAPKDDFVPEGFSTIEEDIPF